MPIAKFKKTSKKAAGIGDDAVKAKTGKTWSQWFAVLDKAGAQKMNHTQIAAYLHDQQDCSGWWSQMVTVGYERERGLREMYQTPEGYQTSASKTFAAPAAVVFQFWVDAKKRNRWLPRAQLTIRKATPSRSLRIVWRHDNSAVDVMIYPKGEAKCQLSVSQRKLKGPRDVAKMKKHWSEALARLEKMIGG
jgi:hypothetical protein